ncbi:hypothetical protein [Sphingomonas sp.]|uniref:hypothetical protein n=1 Tax=Sphingomonas sp. TaxID=28214 RepID=UPI003FA6EB45
MTQIQDMIDETMTAAPDEDAPDRSQQKDAGTDRSIEKRLQRNPESKEARLDRALDESMDASDPPASTQPVHNHGPAPSSGYDEDAEKARQRDA